MNFNPFAKKKDDASEDNYVSPLSSGVEVLEEESSRDTAVAIVRTTYGGIKFIVSMIVLVIFILVTLYTVVCGTIMYTAPAHSGNPTERLWVSRGTFDGGQISPNTVVYGSGSKDAATGFIGRAIEGYIGASDSFVAKTLIGPVGDLSSKGGTVYLNGEKTKLKGNIENYRLHDEYLATCISGSCTPGEFVVVKYPSVSGEVRGLITMSGVKDVSEAK